MGLINIDTEDRSLRTAIIKLLSAETRLSAKEIFEAISIQNKKITYPAVYKTLKMLSKEKKILKQYRKFSLNIEWIQKLKDFIENIERNSQLGFLPSFEHFQKENISETIWFSTYGDADRYRKDIQMEYQNDHAAKTRFPYCAFYRHFKSPLMKSEKILQEIKLLKDKKRGGFLVGKFDTPLDRWCVKFYMRNPKIHVKIVTSLQNVEACETMILGDVVVQTYMPERIKKIIDSIYRKTKSIEDLNALEFYEKVFKVPEKTKIVVFNNKHVAEVLRNQVLGYFEENRL